MKLPYQLPIAIALIGLAASNICSASLHFIADNYIAHNVTVTLKSSSAPCGSTDDSVKDKPPGKYAYSEKIEIQKISNQEILTALLARNHGPIDDTTIKGWSIVLITYTVPSGSYGSPDPLYYGPTPGLVGFFAKKGDTLIDINEYFSTDDDYGFAVTSVSGKRTGVDETYADSGKYTTSFQLLASLELHFPGIYASVSGLLEAPAEGTYAYDSGTTYYQSSLKKADFTSLTGLSYYGYDGDFYETKGIVTGNVTAANGKVTTYTPIHGNSPK